MTKHELHKDDIAYLAIAISRAPSYQHSSSGLSTNREFDLLSSVVLITVRFSEPRLPVKSLGNIQSGVNLREEQQLRFKCLIWGTITAWDGFGLCVMALDQSKFKYRRRIMIDCVPRAASNPMKNPLAPSLPASC